VVLQTRAVQCFGIGEPRQQVSQQITSSIAGDPIHRHSRMDGFPDSAHGAAGGTSTGLSRLVQRRAFIDAHGYDSTPYRVGRSSVDRSLQSSDLVEGA
jgi:hypothetical protein